jgi:DNA repair ATPase RecN
MNKARRKRIQEVIDAILMRVEELEGEPEEPLESPDFEALEDEARGWLEELNSILEEEQEVYDALPDGLQNSSRGDAVTDALNNLQEAISALEALDGDSPLEDLGTKLEEATNALAEAME